MRRDLRYAFRTLRRSPLFTLVALISLAIGIGANVAVFSIADQALLRSLPVEHAGELVYFTSPGPYAGLVLGDNRFSYPMFRDFRDTTAVFDNVAARFSTPVSLAYNGRGDRIQAELVSGTWFDTLGLGVALGRGLGPEDDRVPGGHSVVVLAYDFWRSRFNRDPSILNKVILLNGHPMVVVGVAARGYRGFDIGERIDALVPTMMKAAMTPAWNGLEDRRVLWLQVVARLHAGVPAETAQARLQPFFHALLRLEAESMTFGSRRSGAEFVARPLLLVPAARGVSDLRAALAEPLRILTAIVALLLLIACANVANLLLARALGRRREIAIRLAVGANRGRLVRQLVTESVLLGIGGGALGLLVAAWTVSGLLGLLSSSARIALGGGFDARVFVFAFLLAAVTGVVFGLAPAWQATAPAVAGALKGQAGTVSPDPASVRLRRALAISQVAIALVMLMAAAIFTRSLRNLNRVELGFRRDGLLTFSVDPALNGSSAERIRRLSEGLAERLAAIPGVRSAAVGVNPLVAANDETRTIRIEGRPAAGDDEVSTVVDAIGPGYFATLGIPLVAGREFTARDRLGARRVAIVNDLFARRYFAGDVASAIGHRLGWARDLEPLIEIVGVARASRRSPVGETAAAVVYTPVLQEENPSELVVYARASADPKALFPAVRRAVVQLDVSLPVTGLRTVSEQVAESLAAARLIATLSTCFGAAATVLAAIGLYGVMVFTVARRTREIGIRVALGADGGSLLGMVMREAAAIAGAGVALAIPIGLVLTRLARAQLYEVAPWDPVSIAAAAAAVVAVALAAGYVPAARAARVNPAWAMRHE